MITLNNILQELLEKRSHPELNPKISGYEALKPYANDPDIYISYTSVDKIGINPKSSYNTPFGIYTYPLKGTIWNEVNQAKDSHAVPFAGDNPYIWILKSKDGPGFVKDLYKDYTSKDYDEDMNKIRKLYGDKVEDIEQLIDRSTKLSKDKNAVTAFWNVTRNLAFALVKENQKASMMWNSILRTLGYTGFADRSGKGIIHPSEPTQAVFLSRDAFDVIDKVLNKKYTEPEIATMVKWINSNSTKNMLNVITDQGFYRRPPIKNNLSNLKGIVNELKQPGLKWLTSDGNYRDLEVSILEGRGVTIADGDWLNGDCFADEFRGGWEAPLKNWKGKKFRGSIYLNKKNFKEATDISTLHIKHLAHNSISNMFWLKVTDSPTDVAKKLEELNIDYQD